jgi:hypothetical protein
MRTSHILSHIVLILYSATVLERDGKSRETRTMSAIENEAVKGFASPEARTIERFGKAMADGKALELSERFHSVVQCA